MEFLNPVCRCVFGLIPPYQPELRQHDLLDWYWFQDANLYEINIYKCSLVIKSKSQKISCCPMAFRRFWSAVQVEG